MGHEVHYRWTDECMWLIGFLVTNVGQTKRFVDVKSNNSWGCFNTCPLCKVTAPKAYCLASVVNVRTRECLPIKPTFIGRLEATVPTGLQHNAHTFSRIQSSSFLRPLLPTVYVLTFHMNVLCHSSE